MERLWGRDMAKVETMHRAWSGRSPQQRAAGIEVDVIGAGLVGVGWLLLARCVSLTGREAWGALLIGGLVLVTGMGLLRRHCWARRMTLWLFLVGIASLFAGLWRLDDLLQGLHALRGLTRGEVPMPVTPLSLATDEALLIVLAYWGLGWCAWRLWSRDTSRYFEAQAELRRLRKAHRAQSRSPST